MDKLRFILGRRSSWALPYTLFMVVFVVLPLLLVVYYALVDAEGHFTLYNLEKFFRQTEAVNTFLYSIGVAMITTLLCIVLGYPAAYFMARREFGTPRVMAMLFILPMWINVLLRTLATVALFDFVHLPLGEGALIFGMVYNFLPFMIFPIYNTLQKLDHNLVEAAQDLGATPSQVFRKVILPLSMPGVSSGVVMDNIKLFGTTIQENINSGVMLNYGAALSLIMLIIIGITSFAGDDNDGGAQKQEGLL
jgi:spermidine/putrescine transport system permease protein